MVARRSALLLLLGGALEPSIAAQTYRIGVLMKEDWDPSGHEALLLQELGRRGYVLGANLTIYPRSCGDDLSRLDALASELVKLRVDLILCLAGTPSAQAAKRATSTIPIVMQAARDPVGDGLVASLARPGGNVTGNADVGADLMVKRMQLLMEAVGKGSPVGYLAWRPLIGRKSEREIVDALQAFVAARGAALVIAARNPEEELDAVFASLRRQGVVACVVNAYALIGTTSFEEVTSSMLRHRIPCIMESVTWTRNGVFMSYGESFESITKRAVDYVDRILQGSSPSDLPVSQAKDFDLSINLKTAQAMGISVPRELLLRAAEVIQ